jgi:hypothetical protein
MQVRLMMTDGGPHPPETLAWASAQRIVDDMQENAPNAVYKEVVAIREEIEKIITEHHRLVQDQERSALRNEGSQRLAMPIGTDAYVEDAADDIMSLANDRMNTPLRRMHAQVEGALPRVISRRWPSLGNYFARPETRQYIEDVLHAEFHQVHHIERSWHADAHPDDQHAKAFHAVQRDGHVLLTLHDDDLEEHGGRDLVSAMVINAIPKITAKTEG